MQMLDHIIDSNHIDALSEVGRKCVCVCTVLHAGLFGHQLQASNRCAERGAGPQHTVCSARAPARRFMLLLLLSHTAPSELDPLPVRPFRSPHLSFSPALDATRTKGMMPSSGRDPLLFPPFTIPTQLDVKRVKGMILSGHSAAGYRPPPGQQVGHWL